MAKAVGFDKELKHPHSAPSSSRQLQDPKFPKAPAHRPDPPPLEDPPLLELPQGSPFGSYRECSQAQVLSWSVPGPARSRRLSLSLRDTSLQVETLSLSKTKEDSPLSASPVSKYCSPSTSPSILTVLHQARSLDLPGKLALLREEDSASRLSPFGTTRTLSSNETSPSPSFRGIGRKSFPVKTQSPLNRGRKKSAEGTLFKQQESHHGVSAVRGLRPEKGITKEGFFREDDDLQFKFEPLTEAEEGEEERAAPKKEKKEGSEMQIEEFFREC